MAMTSTKYSLWTSPPSSWESPPVEPLPREVLEDRLRNLDEDGQTGPEDNDWWRWLQEQKKGSK